MNPTEHADPDCPECEGEGIVVVQVTRTGTRWVDDGTGNPIPTPVPILAQEERWCSCLPPLTDIMERE